MHREEFSIFRLILPAITVVGLIAIVVTHWTDAIEKQWYASVIGSVGEAMFIAGVLGFTVDRLLKAQLVRDVAAEALRNSWGVNAPQDYIEKLSQSLGRYTAIALTMELRIGLNWVDEDHSMVRVSYESRSVKQNISDKEWSPAVPGVAPSVNGARESMLAGLEYTIQNPPQGRRAPVEAHERWTAGQLKESLKEADDGGVTLNEDFISKMGVPNVVPGGTCEARFLATRYLHEDGEVYLRTNTPVLSWKVEISGSALEGVVSRAELGQENIKLTEDPPHRGEHGFTHSGVALRVCWRKPRSPEVDEQTRAMAAPAGS